MNPQKIDLMYKMLRPYRYFMARSDFGHLEEMSVPRRYINSYVFRSRNKATDQRKIIFLGDFLSLGECNIKLHKNIRDRIQQADHVVMNLATTLVKDIPGDTHGTKLSAFKKLLDVVPAHKLIIGLANQYAGEYGAESLVETIRGLEKLGVCFIGTSNVPSFEVAPGLKIEALTQWYNDETLSLNTRSKDKESQILRYINWGNEYDPMPSNEQVRDAEELSENHLMSIGHNSHSPQPIQFIAGRLTAFSLGNFLTHSESEKENNGIILQVELLKFDKWRLEGCEWDHLHIASTTDSKCISVETIEREESVPEFY